MDEYILNLLHSKKVIQPSMNQNKSNLVIPTANTPIIDTPIIDTPIIPPRPLTIDDIIRNMASSKEVINDENEVKERQNKMIPPGDINSFESNAEEKIKDRELRTKNALRRYEETVPKLIFILPYRNRKTQREFYSSHMLKILEEFPDTYYKIYYIQQNDNREFNRGAMKNIGFLALKNQYPTYYKDMTIVFNDIDVMPYTKDSINYETTNGVIKHFYGIKDTLGGIFSIKATDFEKTNGFPNIWEWGYDDVIFKNRATKENLTIDYSQFSMINDGTMISLKDDNTILRLEQRNPTKYNIVRSDGFNMISELNYTVNMEDGSILVKNFTLPNTPNMQNTPNTVIRRRGMIF